MSTKVTHHVHTDETAATAPARRLALQTIADLSDRKLAFFHWREASEIMDNVQHKVRDYGEEDSNFEPHDAKDIDEAIDVIMAHLDHVRAIARESGARSQARIKALAVTQQGGAS